MSDYFDNWTVQARKGLLDMCILRVLADNEAICTLSHTSGSSKGRRIGRCSSMTAIRCN